MAVPKDERLSAGTTSEVVFREHEMRYAFATERVRDAIVVDVACGTGLGTALLGMSARACYGLDIDLPTLANARRAHPERSFVACAAHRLSVRSEAVDCVVSFETIEHIQAADAFLAECARVLRPAGLLVISTPNRTVNQRWGPNPFHVREFTEEELVAALSRCFEDIRLFGQTRVTYPLFVLRHALARAAAAARVNALLRAVLRRPVSPPSDPTRAFAPGAWHAECEVTPHVRRVLVRPTYFVALARKPAR
jgi:SAM-dependent methyltransferase